MSLINAGPAALLSASQLKTDLAKAVLPVMVENLLTLDRKQQDYGSANLTKFGVNGVVIRANDKLERIINLMRKGDTPANNESLADSFLDLANYALIAYVMQTKRWPLPQSFMINENPFTKEKQTYPIHGTEAADDVGRL